MASFPPMKSRRSARPLSFALALSALLHAAVLAYLWKERPAAETVLLSPPLEIEITETVKPAPPVAGDEKPPPAPVPPRRRVVRREVARLEVPGTVDPKPPSLTSDAPLREPEERGAITLVPSPDLPVGPMVYQRDEAPTAQSQAARIAREVAAEHRRERQPPNEYFRELRMARITPEELRRRIDAGAGDLAIIDTRSELDVKQVPYLIPGAIWIDADEVDKRHAELPRDREIVLYCT